MSGIPHRLSAGRTLSFEYFPPATTEARRSALRTVARLAGRHPDFVSVTYGAGGSDRGRTRQMVFDVASWHNLVTTQVPCDAPPDRHRPHAGRGPGAAGGLRGGRGDRGTRPRGAQHPPLHPERAGSRRGGAGPVGLGRLQGSSRRAGRLNAGFQMPARSAGCSAECRRARDR
ncbi:MAG: methylenetetrahydrofolate reductase [Actinomycetota bacterium]|nr:methylenetetrahydrofolate reductase [Actinomycetota bacterium]